MADIQTDILAALRMQEAALLGVLETVRQAIQTILSTQTSEALDGMNTESTDVARRFMNQVLAELGVQFTSADIFERAKKLKPGTKRDFLKRAIIRLELSGAIRKIEAGRGRRPAPPSNLVARCLLRAQLVLCGRPVNGKGRDQLLRDWLFVLA